MHACSFLMLWALAIGLNEKLYTLKQTKICCFPNNIRLSHLLMNYLIENHHIDIYVTVDMRI